MGLTNQQYDSIMRRYSEHRLASKHLLDTRTAEVYEKCPKMKELDREIARGSVERGKRAILGDTAALCELSATNAAISQQKHHLLSLLGYSEDYLDPTYVCPLCKDTGYIGPSRKCTCFKSALTDLIYAESGLKDVLMRENFETFDINRFSNDPADIDPVLNMTPRANMLRIAHQTKLFIRDFDTSFQNLLIYGPTGVGKTFLTNCIAKELLDSAHTVLYYTAYGFFDCMEKRKFGSGDDAEHAAEVSMDSIIDSDLLIIDDLGTELSNTFTSFILYSILNERSLRQRSTIITTNLSFDDLSVRYTERVFSRIHKEYEFIKIIGKDLRY